MREMILSFIQGASTCACFVIALYFSRFFRASRDRFFLLFSLAFLILAIERTSIVTLVARGDEIGSSIYILRLAAFILIVLAIIDKNRK